MQFSVIFVILSLSLVSADPDYLQKGSHGLDAVIPNVHNLHQLGSGHISHGSHGDQEDIGRHGFDSGFISSGQASLSESQTHSFQPSPTFVEDLTVTVRSTVDVLTTLTETIFNSVPVTLTNFVKTTLTRPVREEVTTLADDVVFVSSVADVRPNVATVTNVRTRFNVLQETSTEIFSILHVDEIIKQSTTTATDVQTHVFRPLIIHTVIRTENEIVTESLNPFNVQFINSPGRHTSKHYY